MTGPVADKAVSVQTVDPLADPDWDSAIGRLPAAECFHSQAWARVLRDAYGYSPRYLAARAGKELVGLLPCCEIDSWLTGRRGVSLPFSDTCTLLAHDDETRRELVAAALRQGSDRHWRYCEFRDAAAAPLAPASAVYHGHTLDLTEGEPALLVNVDPAARRGVRKAERCGVEVEFSRDAADLRAFYALLGRTRRRHGVPPQPYRFFEEIRRHIVERGHGTLALAWHGPRPIAGALFLHCGSRALYKFGASDEAFQSLRPSNLVMWRAIQWHAAAGFEVLDLGRTDIGQEGLRRFKLNWGARERTIRYVTYDFRRREFVARRATAHRWRAALVKLLPPPVVRWIGAVLYRHIG